jgi:hypothetical protein
MLTPPSDPTSIPPTPPKSKTWLWLGLGLVFVIVLVGAAFLAGRLLNQPMANAGPQTLMTGPGGGIGPGAGEMMSVQIQVTPAPELPKLTPEVAGMFISREDNRLLIGICNMGVAISSSSSGGGSGPETVTQGCEDGQQVEVVVTQETKVYRETTQFDPASPPSGSIQQTVAPGSVEELSSNVSVMVWGRRTGDRVIADVLSYSQPMVVSFPGP